MQAVIVNTEVVGDLVHGGHQNFSAEVGFIVDVGTKCQPVQRDPVREVKGAVVASLRERSPLIETEQILGRVSILDQDDDVVEQRTELGWELVERIAD